MDFAIVEFTEDKTVEVVPSNWLEGQSVCLWPPYRGVRFQNAVKRKENPAETWTRNSARVLSFYGTYSNARNRLSKAEETSALETDDDCVVAATSRNRRRKLQYSDFDYDNDTVVPPPTKSNRVAKSGSSVLLPQLPSPPASLTSSVALTSLTDGTPPCEARRRSPRKNAAHAKGSGDSVQEFASPAQANESSITSGSRKRSDDCSTLGLEAQSSPECPTPASSVTDTSHMVKRAMGPPTTSGLPSSDFKLVLLKLARLEQQQNHMTQLLQRLMDVVQTSDDTCVLPDGISLPLHTITAVNELQRKLEDEGTFKMLACYLGSIGGRDVPETTRRIMRSVFSNAVATRMNFLGRGGKTAIQNTALLRCIIVAVRRNKLHRRATRAEVESIVKLWLRYAADRDGGRQARARKGISRRAESDVESE